MSSKSSVLRRFTDNYYHKLSTTANSTKDTSDMPVMEVDLPPPNPILVDQDY